MKNMRGFNYTITNLILNYLIKYELAISELKHYPLPDKYKIALEEKHGAEDIENLGNLVGFPIGYNKSLQIQRGQEMPSQRKNLKLFTNFRNAKDFVTSYGTSNSLRPSIELASHLNKLIFKGIVDDWDVAKLRGFSEKPNEIYDTWYKCRDYYPNLDLTGHFNELFDWIRNGKDQNHKLVKLGILMYEFIDKAPFFAGNQITAILIFEMLTKQYDYNPENMMPFFKSFNLINEDILSAFKMSKGKRDLTIFLEAFLYTISLTAIEISIESKDTHIKKVKKQGALEVQLNPRQIKIIEYLGLNHKITRSLATKMMGVSFMTSYRDMQDMLDKGYIKQKGLGRGTFYVLTKEKEEAEDGEILMQEIA